MSAHQKLTPQSAQDVTATLTDAERETLNAAAAIIMNRTPLNASWLIMGSNHFGDAHVRVTYFDTNKEQHSDTAGKRITGDTFADNVQSALDIQQGVYADAEGYKARRRELLKAELAALDVAA